MSPASHTEIELKRLLVGPGAADQLLRVLGPRATEKRQLNHIFDTPHRRVSQHRYAVRLRFEDGIALLTIKGPGRAVGADTSSRTEAECQIGADAAREILSGERDPVAVLRERVPAAPYAELWSGLERALEGEPLRALGCFENLRRTVPVTLPSGLALTVELDRTQFPDGHVDEEVEVEVAREDQVAQVEAWLEAQVSAAGIATTRSTPKVARFYARIGA